MQKQMAPASKDEQNDATTSGDQDTILHSSVPSHSQQDSSTVEQLMMVSDSVPEIVGCSGPNFAQMEGASNSGLSLTSINPSNHEIKLEVSQSSPIPNFRQNSLFDSNISRSSPMSTIDPTNIMASGVGTLNVNSPYSATGPASSMATTGSVGNIQQPSSVQPSSVQPPSVQAQSTGQQQLYYQPPPIAIVDHRTLAQALTPEKESRISSFEHYLLGQTFLVRLHACIERCRSAVSAPANLKLPVTSLTASPGSLTITFPAYSLPNLPTIYQLKNQAYQQSQQFSQPCTVRFHIFMCPERYRLVARLAYADGVNLPNDSDVRIFEQFFERYIIVPHFTEMAILSFITLARLTTPSIFESVARLMKEQLENFSNFAWHADLRLVIADNPPTEGGAQMRLSFGVMVSLTNQSILFTISLSPRMHRSADTDQLTRTLNLSYNISKNELDLYPAKPPQPTTQDNQIKEIFAKAHRDLIMQWQQTTILESGDLTPPCCIWPCIRSLLMHLQV